MIQWSPFFWLRKWDRKYTVCFRHEDESERNQQEKHGLSFWPLQRRKTILSLTLPPFNPGSLWEQGRRFPLGNLLTRILEHQELEVTGRNVFVFSWKTKQRVVWVRFTDLKKNFSHCSLSTVVPYCCCSVAKLYLTLLRPHGLANQAPLSMGFSRQKYWSWLPFLPVPGIEPQSPTLQANSLPLSHQGSPHKGPYIHTISPEPPFGPWVRSYYYPHSTHEEASVRSSVTCLRSVSHVMRPKRQNRPVQLARQGSHLLASLPCPLPSTVYFYKIAMLSRFKVHPKKLHSPPHHGHEQEDGALLKPESNLEAPPRRSLPS